VIVMITRARVSGCFDSSAVAGAVLLGSAVIAGLLTGGVLGLAGAALDPVTRWVLAGLAAVAVLCGASAQVFPWQLNRETHRRWLEYEDWRTAATNGFALGLGFTTRIGFWLFYLVLLSAFVVADPMVSAVGYAVFAVSRVGGSILLWIVGFQVAGRGWLPRLQALADAVTFVVLGYLITTLAASVQGHLQV
jgi:hypothetical protein